MRALTNLVLLTATALSLLALSGCGDETAARQAGPEPVPLAEGAPAVRSVAVTAGEPYVETVDLPGATVHGMESTRLMAKLGGYVKEIRQIVDPNTGQSSEVDIGMRVARDDVLAVLDIPEMHDELNEKQALVRQAESAVQQAEAAIRQAEAEMASAAAALDEATTEREEKEALRVFQEADLQRYSQLFKEQAGTKELVERAESQFKAATAVLTTVEAHIRTAQANVTAAEANRDKAIADLGSAEAHVDVAQAAVGRLETLMDYAEIRAPFDGVVTARLVDHGAFVRSATSNSGATALFEVTRTDRLRIVASVPMSRVESVTVGQAVLFRGIGGLPGVSIEGRVSRLALDLDHGTRMRRVEIDMDNPVENAAVGGQPARATTTRTETSSDADGRVVLMPGMYGTVSLLREWSDLRVVPTTAISTSGGQGYVMLIEKDPGGQCRCHRRVVQIVYNDALEVRFSGGVEPGDLVVADDVASLSDGQLVTVRAGD